MFLFKIRGPRGLKSLTGETCLTYSFAQNDVLLGVGPLMHKLESPCPKVASYQNINAFGPLVCERNIFQIPKISPTVPSFWVQTGTSP